MRRIRIYYLLVLCFIFSCLTISTVYGYDDGFSAAGKSEGKYFTVFLASGVDEGELIPKINISQTDKILTGADQGEISFTGLAGMLDILFLRVSGILDIPLYSFKGNIKICKDNEQLARIYSNLFTDELEGRLSFYIPELNTIYVSTDSFTRAIVGHEIAHALINRYFVVPPPMKTQEILSGYVEYQLRKTTR